MNPDTPLISVIMPAYNAAKYLPEAIASVLNQTETRWELLILDDASSDDTPNLVAAIQSETKDPRIVYERLSKRGRPSAVRNHGLQKATGKYIAFLDADDAYFPTALETLSSLLEENPQRIAAYGFAASMNETGKPLPEMDMLKASLDGTYQLPPGYSHSWGNLVLAKFSCLLPALMVRKSVVKAIGPLNEGLLAGEDYEFYIRLFVHNQQQVYCTPTPIYRYRVYANSLTKTVTQYKEVLQSCLTVMRWLFTDAGIPEDVSAYQSQSCLAAYRYLARERLIHNQPAVCREFLWQAWLDKDIKRMDWLQGCLQLFIRSLLPQGINQHLITLKQGLTGKRKQPLVGAPQ